MLNLLKSLGAVICGRNFLNPVSLARKIMYDSPHCVLSGDGALKFAKDEKFPTCDPEELISPLAKEKMSVSYEDYLKWASYYYDGKPVQETLDCPDTVSAVALDAKGHLACATSTGTSKFAKADK